MAEWITVQGTKSDSGKSLITEIIIDILSDRGEVAPFKPVNFSRNAFPVKQSEVGYSTFHQAQKAGVDLEKYMAPILVKPMKDKAEFIVNKEVEEVNYNEIDGRIGDYYGYVESCMDSLDRRFDYIVWEGFGSIINSNMDNNPNIDLLNKVDAEIVLVGDISQGGTEASMKGVNELLDKEISLNIVNKASKEAYRISDTEEFIQKTTGTETVTVPFIEDLDFPREDGTPELNGNGDIVVIDYPHASNTSDLQFLPSEKTLLAEDPEALDKADLVILPGSKNTVSDLRWMKNRGLDDKLVEKTSEAVVFGVCGGFQMLGDKISGNSTEEGEEKGLGILDFETELGEEKTLEKVEYSFSGEKFEGYRIHYGDSNIRDQNLFQIGEENEGIYGSGVGGTYIHDSLSNRDFLEFLLNEADLQASEKGSDASEIKSILKDYF